MALVSEEEVFPWVEKTLGEKIIRSRRQGGRESGGRPGWFITTDGIAGENRYYARACRDEDWGFTTIYGLKREGDVLQVLYDAGIPVPKIIARSETPPVLLMEYIEGENDFTLLDGKARRNQLAEHFAEVMAGWHAIDSAEFAKLGFSVPETAEDYVLQDLEVWEQGCFPLLLEPVPLISFACKWLRNNIPPAPQRPVLVQGDTGPGQFLYSNGKVQAVIDFELAFLGDPMRELAQIRTRDVWYPTGNLMHWFHSYSEKSGVELDFDKLRYYNVIAMLITTMALSPYVQQPNPRDDHAEWYAQDAWSKLASAQALLDALQITEPAPQLPQAGDNRFSKLYDILIDNLQEEQLPHIEDEFLAHRMNMDIRLLHYTRTVQQIGGEIEQLELDDISRLLGRKPDNLQQATRELDKLVRESGPERDEEFARYFYRHGMREVALMEGAMGRAANASTTPLDESKQ